MESLLNLKVGRKAKIVNIDNMLPAKIIKRLNELGFVRGNKIKMLYKNSFAKACIVSIYSTPITIDFNVVKHVMVEELK